MRRGKTPLTVAAVVTGIVTTLVTVTGRCLSSAAGDERGSWWWVTDAVATALTELGAPLDTETTHSEDIPEHWRNLSVLHASPRILWSCSHENTTPPLTGRGKARW